MHGVVDSGNCRKIACPENHYLEGAQTATQQAIEGTLQGIVIFFQVDHQEGQHGGRIFIQVTQYPLPCQTLWSGLLKGLQNFPRRRALQQALNIRSIVDLQPLVPALHLLFERAIFFLFQHTHQTLTHASIEKPK
ncbi:hypothetical protein D3C77_429990 [compost metagenome]